MITSSDLKRRFEEHFMRVWRCPNFPRVNSEEKKGCKEWKVKDIWIPDLSYFRPWGGFLGNNYKGILIVGGSPSAKGIKRKGEKTHGKSISEERDRKAFEETEKFVNGQKGFEDLMDYYKSEWIPRWGNVLIAKLAKKGLIDCVAYVPLLCCRCVKEDKSGYRNYNVWEDPSLIEPCKGYFKEAVKILDPKRIVGMWTQLKVISASLEELMEGRKIDDFWKGRGSEKKGTHNYEVMEKIHRWCKDPAT